jgi:hypothetical protein
MLASVEEPSSMKLVSLVLVTSTVLVRNLKYFMKILFQRMEHDIVTHRVSHRRRRYARDVICIHFSVRYVTTSVAVYQ